MGAGLVYVLDVALHADTDSYGDHGTLALIALGFAASSLAASLLSDLSRMVRVALMMAFVLIGIAFGGLIGGFGGALPLILALVAGGSWVAELGFVLAFISGEEVTCHRAPLRVFKPMGEAFPVGV
jgi:hypothetical protein